MIRAQNVHVLPLERRLPCFTSRYSET